MNRNYEDWIKEIAKKNIAIRHDIDFDIEMADKMMAIERKHGLKSYVYLDVHSPSYSIDDIAALIKKYPEFIYGLHINIAYFYPAEDCFGILLEDIKLLGKYTMVHSCVGHLYSERVIKKPEFNNVTIEQDLVNHPELPQSFYSFFSKRQRLISDSGGIIFSDPIDVIKNASNSESYFCLFHPIHYRFDGKVTYTKRLGGTGISSIEDIDRAQKSIGHITTYFSNGLANIPTLVYANNILNKIVNKRYRSKVVILDAGCGIGLLGAPLMLSNNVKYIGLDIEEKFITAGRRMFDYLGYEPQMIVGDIFKTQPKADVFVFLAYEDCPIDYDKLLKLIKENYKTVVMTIVTENRYEIAKKKGKKYWYIPEEKFESVMLEEYKIISKILFDDPKNGGRILYWMES